MGIFTTEGTCELGRRMASLVTPPEKSPRLRNLQTELITLAHTRPRELSRTRRS